MPLTKYARIEESPYPQPARHGDGSVAEYWALVDGVTLCDVAYERQVEFTGPDAMALAQMLVTRDLSRCEVGQCRYVFMTNTDGGIIADPVLLRLNDERIWLSAADADVHLWCQELARQSGLDVSVSVPDVAPVQIQGPRAVDLMVDIFGDEIGDMGYFRVGHYRHKGLDLVISRSGWGEALGYEVYVQDARADNNAAAQQWWNTVVRAGERHDVLIASPNHVRRIEAGMLAHGYDMDDQTNPFEVDMGYCWMVNLDHPDDFVGRSALERIRRDGPTRRLVGVDVEGPSLGSVGAGLMPRPLDVLLAGEPVGALTSACFSPRLNKNIGYAMVPIEQSDLGTRFTINHPRFGVIDAVAVQKPHWRP